MFDGEKITPNSDRIAPDSLLTVVGSMENGSHGLIDRSAYFVDAEGLIYIASDALVIDEKLYQASLSKNLGPFVEDYCEEDPYSTLTNDDFVKVVKVDENYILIDTLGSGLHVPDIYNELGIEVNTYVTDIDEEEALIEMLDSSIDGLANDFDSLHVLAISLVKKTMEHLGIERNDEEN